MWFLYLGIVLFAAPHLFSVLVPAARDGLKNSWGENRFKAFYAVLSLAGVVLMALGYWAGRKARGADDFLDLPSGLSRHFIMAMIFLGFVLIFSAQSRSHIRLWLKQPFSLGIILWSLGHLLANGRASVVPIFATFFVIAVFDAGLSFARGKVPDFEPRWSHDIRGIAVAIVVAMVFVLWFHPYVLGIPLVS